MTKTAKMERKTASFILTESLYRHLRLWSRQEDQSISATLRCILEAEVTRRTAAPHPQPQPVIK